MAIGKHNSNKIFKKQAQQALHATPVEQTCGILWHVGACWIKWKPNYMCSLSRRFAGDKARRADRLTCWPTVPPTAAAAIANFAFSFSHICCCSAALPIITTPASSLWPAAGVCVCDCKCVCVCVCGSICICSQASVSNDCQAPLAGRGDCGGVWGGVATPSAGVVWCARKLLLQWNLSGLNLLKCRCFRLYVAWAEIRFEGFASEYNSTRINSTLLDSTLLGWSQVCLASTKRLRLHTSALSNAISPHQVVCGIDADLKSGQNYNYFELYSRLLARQISVVLFD